MLGGAALLWRGLSGWCHLYEALGINSSERTPNASLGPAEGIRLEASVVIQRSPSEVFQFWRKLSNLPTIFSHLRSVTEQNFKHSHWVASLPLGLSVEWDAEIITARVGEIISWRSMEGSSVATAGSVRFEPAGNGDTNVHVLLRYSPPAGRLGANLVEWFGNVPDEQLEADLQAFKKTMEAQDMTERIAPSLESVEEGERRRSSVSQSATNESGHSRWHVGDVVSDASGARAGKVIGIEQSPQGTLDRSETRYIVQWDDSPKGEGHLRDEDLRAVKSGN